MESSILIEKKEGVAFIFLNRPQVYNAFNREMALQLQTILTDCQNDESVRALVISGKGRAFSAGQDLAEVIDPNGPEISKIIQEHYNPLVLQIREMPKPVIAAVNGVAAGAGANLALCCDIVLAKSSAYFLQAFSKIGLIPDTGGTFFLPRLIGFQKASAAMILADKISAPQAETWGMVYKVFEEEVFEENVQKIAQQLAQMPTKALWFTKQALNQSLQNSLAAQLQLEDNLQTAAAQTYDYNEGVAAFIEKRSAIFKGK
ncbi:MAG: enoyl-CoA hydratase-related protein [Chitinophagales bacterium]|nr:enoyl-CoA hydratase/isomerase family protein [Bacteroidota bacterium]MCB9044068.1 enoyl-CoA hydratase/isomerase family protein [Chitinophagales bacterium]